MERPRPRFAISSMQSIPMLKEFLNDERPGVRETWNNPEPKRRNLKWRTRGSTSILLLVDLFIFCRQFTSEDPPPPSSLARLTQRPTFRLSLKPSLNRPFPYSSDTGPSSPCEASALHARSTRSLQPCSRRMKSALSSLSMRSPLSLARCRTLIPSRR